MWARIDVALFLMAFSAGVWAEPQSIDDGLVAHYPLDGNAEDTSGNGPDGKLENGVEFIHDVSGRFVATFDGIDDRILLPDPAAIQTPYYM